MQEQRHKESRMTAGAPNDCVAAPWAAWNRRVFGMSCRCALKTPLTKPGSGSRHYSKPG